MPLRPSTLVTLRRFVLPTSHTTLLCTRATWFELVDWLTGQLGQNGVGLKERKKDLRWLHKKSCVMAMGALGAVYSPLLLLLLLFSV